jgi:large subunit ribosomal protein L9
MEIILLERISRLGNVGDVVNVKNGFARNFLLPAKKALRATEINKKQFESQRDALEAQNAKSRTEAEKLATTMQSLTVTLVRQASEDGKLFGSVAVRDIADMLNEQGHSIERRQVDLKASIKTLGVYPAAINLHPEVQVSVQVHVARNAESPLPPLEDEIEAEAENIAAADTDETATDASEETAPDADDAQAEEAVA